MDKKETKIEPKRKKSLKVNTPELWSAITSGVRFEIITFLSSSGPCSIAELAKLLNVAADGLYHHIKILMKVGMVVEIGFEKIGRQNQAIIDVAADQFHFDVHTQKAIADNIERLKKLNSTIFRRSEQLFTQALESGVICFNNDERNAFLRSDIAWLKETEKKRAIELMNELLEIFEKGRNDSSGELYSLTFQFSPVVRSRKPKS